MANENIFYSKEARWFFKEKQSKLEIWFNEHGAFFKTEKERTDFYERNGIRSRNRSHERHESH